MLALKTSSKHKEMTPGAKVNHAKHVANLKKQLKTYGIDPFSNERPRSFATGVEIEQNIASDMLRAAEHGDQQYLKFVQDRLISGEKSFFDPIPRNRLSTGIKKKQKAKASIGILKEDKQAFGLMVSKSVSMEEAFNFPITSVPLSIATTEYSLRQSDKSQFRNLLIKESDSTTDVVPKRCAWLTDGMAAIRSLKAKTTYREFIDCLVQFVTPSRELEPNSVGIINDTGIIGIINAQEKTEEKKVPEFISAMSTNACCKVPNGKASFTTERTRKTLFQPSQTTCNQRKADQS